MNHLRTFIIPDGKTYPAPRDPKGCGWDIETNGLLFQTDRIHCMWIKDIRTAENWGYADHVLINRRAGTIKDGFEKLCSYDFMVAHNGIDFDRRVAMKLYPEYTSRLPILFDTITMMKMVLPADRLWDMDIKLVKTGKLSQKFAKRYSLASIGARLGNAKGDYDGGWEELNQDMFDYNEQDVEVQHDAWFWICKLMGIDPLNPWEALPTDESQQFSYSMQSIFQEQTQHLLILEEQAAGFGFDLKYGTMLAAQLSDRHKKLTAQLIDTFGSWWIPLDDPKVGKTQAATVRTKMVGQENVTTKRFSEKTGKPLKDYVGPPISICEEGSTFVRIKRHTFNPSSRQDIAERLQVLYGWEPRVFGENGAPTLDEGTIKSLDVSVVPEKVRLELLEYFVVAKTLGALQDGKKSWLNMLGKYDNHTKFGTNTIHCAIGTNDAATGRGIHREPNLSQVSGVMKDKQKNILKGFEGRFGWECRSCFVPVNPEWEQTGTDASALEFVMLGHDLARYDGGKFAERVSDPSRDIHEDNGKLSDLPRQDAKTVGYMDLFGAGPLLIGEAVSEGRIYTDEEQEALLGSRALESYIKFIKKMMGANYKEFTRQEKLWIAKGSEVRSKFENGIDGLKQFKKDIKEVAEARGWIKMFGGDRVYVKKSHVALNYRLQGNGARVCKLWGIALNQRLQQKEGLVWGRDYVQMLWVHDEYQFAHLRDRGIGQIIKHHSDEAIKEVGKHFGVRGILRTDSKTGNSWAECH
jgi:DNA polymerase I